MAAAALVGLLLNQLLGWWWADIAAGLALIYWIRGEAAEAMEAAAGLSGQRTRSGDKLELRVGGVVLPLQSPP